MRIVECVPNFSEGYNESSIDAIADAILSVEGVRLLNIDQGRAAARTVMTFAGDVDPLCEAAFRAVRVASEVIDMRTHHGEHPRIGATDVLPLVPISGIKMADLLPYVRVLGERIGNELGIPVYLYQSSASAPHRSNLAECRKGEYEGLRAKLQNPEWRPDFGPSEWNERVARSGLTVLGARDYLVAVNFNLNTTSAKIASSIAKRIRQSGYVDSRNVRVPGLLPTVKAIGWYIAEYDRAQVSTNLTNINITSLHRVFKEVSLVAQQYGVRVTGTEIIGLVPERVLVDAGRHFFSSDDYRRCIEPSKDELIDAAIKYMGLDELAPFDPNGRIIERML